MRTGRPTDYKPEYCDRIRQIGSEGYSVAEMAADLGCRKQTLYNWGEKYPDFFDAFKDAVELSEAWWTQQGRTALYLDKFQTGLWSMNMKNRFGWADKTDTKLTGDMKVTEVKRVIVDPKVDE